MKTITTVCCVVFLALAAGCGGSTTLGGQDGRADQPPDTGGEETVDLSGEVPEQDAPTEEATADPPFDAPADGAEDATVEPPADVSVDDNAVEPPTDAADAADSVDAPACEGGCMTGLTCCGGRCVNLQHDPAHCSRCGNACTGATPFCAMGACAARPCDVMCIGTKFCCGGNCCDLGQVCCQVDGPGPSGGPACYDGVCPGGCPPCL